MPSWGAPATPREWPGRSKERPAGSKIVLRSGPIHPRVSKNVVRTPPDPENLNFLKIDVSHMKNLGFQACKRPKFAQSGPQTLPNKPQTAKNCIKPKNFNPSPRRSQGAPRVQRTESLKLPGEACSLPGEALGHVLSAPREQNLRQTIHMLLIAL